MLIPFFLGFGKMAKSLHDDILIRMSLFVFRYILAGFSPPWKCLSVIASGIHVIFFLSEISSVRIQLCKLGFSVCGLVSQIQLYVVTFEVSDSKAGK